MARGLTFDAVRTIVAGLDGVEEGTAYCSPCLRVKKTMIAGIAINKAVEPNTLMVRMPFDERDELIAEQPDIYYLKPHYEPYPCVLVRLGKVPRDALKDLLVGAWRQASAKPATAPRRRAATVPSRRSGMRRPVS